MSGTLFVVATPIGNLEDITLRALRVLREADVIAAEDTRRTAKLLGHYSISTPTLSFHAHNTRSRIPQLLSRLQGGATVALVTDAGTPGISDPGTELVQICWEMGVPVDPIPGPSAPLAAAVASGFRLDPLTIYGFAPARSKDRKTWLSQLRATTHTFTFFEAPHRIRQTLAELGTYFADRPIMVARELTKLHQELLMLPRGSGEIWHMPECRGEFTLVVGAQPTVSPAAHVPDEKINSEFRHMTAERAVTRRGAVSMLARKYGRSTKYIYSVVERFKDKGD